MIFANNLVSQYKLVVYVDISYFPGEPVAQDQLPDLPSVQDAVEHLRSSEELEQGSSSFHDVELS